ncbi:HisA/HisF-related TIM barrel protein [Candidatus Laterigemmans baculatus]|uniref:HisA/HisF-related TIM barrel protein n=1 Tax=Candidatus Laterigemmans baculatus TaxID=2770505 RepID=UPI00193C6887|nr:HisA/HisF-related TIM barrel protein [Candidatus Laterigemmans baculatus]
MSGADRGGTAAVGAPVPLLGVIDLRFGQAVHAVAGRRDAYQPVRIAACPDGDPVRVAEHYRGRVTGLYVADLDRILDRSAASQPAIDRLLALGMPLWIDRGIESAADFQAVAGSSPQTPAAPAPTTWIVASESLRSLDELRQIDELRQMAAGQGNAAAALPLTVSLDLRDGRVVSASRELAREPLEAAEQLAAAGAERLIVLDVARVGTGSGPSTASLCRQIKRAIPALTLCSGGGVRDAADAATLQEAGCDVVLAASWLLQSNKCLTSSPKPR